jgi:hypothetical protein
MPSFFSTTATSIVQASPSETAMNRGCLCIVYVSEALNLQTIGQLTSAAGPALLHSFPDPTYNRTGFYLAGPNIVDTAAKFCDLAFSL